jgi:4-hydroxy-tetrahydrodipicolinate synthase
MKGVIAAVATPVDANGRLNVQTFERLIDRLIESGVDGVCLGGATSEYPSVAVDDRKAAIDAAAPRVPRDRTFLVAIGAPTLRQVVDLGHFAQRAGCRAVLLPMPMFFRYQQDDLRAFAVEASRALAAPVLLYDLPEFTNPLEPDTVIRLLNDEPFITGIKDSSGTREHLSAYADARHGRDWTLLVGHDELLFEGLSAGWNGTVSGIACFCPELPVAIYRSHASGDVARARALQTLLDEVIVQLGALPAPWGVRVALELRGFDMGPLPLPLSTARRQQVDRFREWLPRWIDRVSGAVAGASI